MSNKTVLLTSVGVETGPNVINALRQSRSYHVTIIGVDKDRLAAGLYLCDEHFLVPPADQSGYLDELVALAKKTGATIIMPLYSKEIRLFSGHKKLFAKKGIGVAVPDPKIVDLCDHKGAFVEYLHRHNIAAPTLYTESGLSNSDFPVFVKPVRGSSSRHAGIAYDAHDLAFYKRRGGDVVIQELLGGPEFTIDIVGDLSGRLKTAVIRERLLVKDGKAVKSKTVHNTKLMHGVEALLNSIPIIGPANAQCILHNGRYAFFELNPRFSAGGLPLTTKAGVNIPELVIKLLVGDPIDPKELQYKPNMYMSRYLTEVFPTI